MDARALAAGVRRDDLAAMGDEVVRAFLLVRDGFVRVDAAFALFHGQRLIEGVCQPKASSIYLAMLDHLRGVEWHSRQVAEKLANYS